MADMQYGRGHLDEPDWTAMSREELRGYLRELRERLEALDMREPQNMTGPAYDAWAEQHELLEDQVDEVLDRLDEIE